MHLGYRKRKGVVVTNQVKIKGMDIDIRTDGGIEMIPNSSTEKGTYRWLGEGLFPISELPVAKVGWTRDRVRRVMKPLDPPAGTTDERIRRALGYVAAIEGAISGAGGHAKAMRVAGVLVQKFGLSIAEALPIYLAWNEQCEPPFSMKEVMHKLEDAERLRGTPKALR